MKSKKIEEHITKQIIHSGNFSSVSNRLDYSKIESISSKGNIKYAILGLCSSLAAIGIIVGSAFAFNSAINNHKTSKNTSTETSSSDPLSPDISIEVPSITYNGVVYFYNTEAQTIDTSRLYLKLDEFDVVTKMTHQNLHVLIYSLKDSEVDEEIAAYFKTKNTYYSYIKK